MLDTHTLIWWVNESEPLSNRAEQTISETLDGGGELLVSSITAWEIALLVRKGRLVLAMDVTQWITTTAAIDGVRYIPVDNEIGIHSVELPGEFHADPADRIIVAMARRFNVPLVTADQRILAYEHVNTVW